MMKKIILTLATVLLLTAPAHAFWMWTPETNKWVNPKYAVKDTPQEQLAFALEFYNAKEYKKANDEFEKLIKHYPKAREAAEAQYYMGMAMEEQGLLYQAFKNYQVVIDKYPFSERVAEIIGRQFEIANQLMDGKQKRGKFMSTVVGADYDVIEVYRAVIKNAPYGPHAAPSQYKIGLYLQEKQLYQESRDEFEKTMNDYPDSEWAKAAKYQIALSDAKRSSRAQYDQKVTDVAIKEFKDFVAEHPDAELSSQAQDEIQKLREKEAENNFVIGSFYAKQKKYDAARIYFTAIVERYQQTSWAPQALEKIREINGLAEKAAALEAKRAEKKKKK